MQGIYPLNPHSGLRAVSTMWDPALSAAPRAWPTTLSIRNHRMGGGWILLSSFPGLPEVTARPASAGAHRSSRWNVHIRADPEAAQFSGRSVHPGIAFAEWSYSPDWEVRL